MSFYVAIPSYVRPEFPGNKTNAYKVRLATPLKLPGDGWRVGLAAASLPNSRADLYRLMERTQDDVILAARSRMERLAANGNPHTVSTSIQFKTLLQDPSTSDGVSLMKALLSIMDRDQQDTVFAGQEGKLFDKFRITYTWEGDELVLEDKLWDSIVYSGAVCMQFSVGVKFAKLMGWLRGPKNNAYTLGPNLRRLPPYDESEKSYSPLTKTELSGNAVWKVENNLLKLSLRARWHFVNLNVAFRQVVGEPTRTLHVYTNVNNSTTIGDQVTALLREIRFQQTEQGVVYFEPLHVQYVPCSRRVLEIVEVEVAETDGQPALFDEEGATIITLHFRRG